MQQFDFHSNRLHNFIIQKAITSQDGIKINYEISGKGAPLLFIHGLGGDLRAWDKERAAFEEKGYTTLAVDLRGHGLSDRPTNEKAYDFKNFALDVNAVIKEENLKNVVIIGHCLGGMVAMTHEYLFPKTSKALILVDTSYKPPTFGNLLVNHKVLEHFLFLLFKYIPNYQKNGKVDYQKFVGGDDFNKKRLFSDVVHTSLKSYMHIMKNLLSFDGKKLLDGITVPTLIIQGENDTVFPPEIAEYIHKRIKHSELELIPDANHIIVLNNPKELTESILEFIKKL